MNQESGRVMSTTNRLTIHLISEEGRTRDSEMTLCVLPDILMSFHIETVEVVVSDHTLLFFFVFAFAALHYSQFHLHGDVYRKH